MPLSERWKENGKLTAMLLAAGAAIFALGCGEHARVHAPPPASGSSAEMGVATWYGHPYHGRAAASGEIYDMNRLTAAHRTLPFGTRVRVHNLENSKTVDVKINDRGPFVDGRMIDLSRAAARALGIQKAGTARVRLEVLSVPKAVPDESYAVQVGAFQVRSNAERCQKEMEKRYGFAEIVPRQGDPLFWRVIAGQFASLEDAQTLVLRIRAETGIRSRAAFVVRRDQNPQ